MFPNKASLESLLSNHLAQAGTNYSIYFDVMLLLKAIHIQLLPVYLPYVFNLEKDNSVTATPKAQCLINCKLFLYYVHVLLEN